MGEREDRQQVVFSLAQDLEALQPEGISISLGVVAKDTLMWDPQHHAQQLWYMGDVVELLFLEAQENLKPEHMSAVMGKTTLEEVALSQLGLRHGVRFQESVQSNAIEHVVKHRYSSLGKGD